MTPQRCANTDARGRCKREARGTVNGERHPNCESCERALLARAFGS